MADQKPTVTIDGLTVEFAGEHNLLEIARKAGISIPTFCYHSDLSVYGACRLCLVEVEKRGVVASCSTTPEPGMIIRTHTKQIREIRKINLELLLANHKRECTSCDKSDNCTLLSLATQFGIDEVPFQKKTEFVDLDFSSPSIVRDPDKCILCGDCVRVCAEVQSVGVIEFTHRGSKAQVGTAFNSDLGKSECVNCGQCVAVCPTGALVPHSNRDEVWKVLDDPSQFVVAQIAPSVRVAVGEAFGLKPGEDVTGKIVAALRRMGFDRVFDTCYGADMTIVEEATEFLQRFKANKDMPMFTSCCPGWVKFVEVYYPEMLPHLSTSTSPQAMFGATAKKVLPEQYKIDQKNFKIVSIMPCTAKKFEAKLDKFKRNGIPDNDIIITTHELIRMIKELGIHFEELPTESLDMPMGFYTGGGVIFGATGGVMEAALRFAAEKLTGEKMRHLEFKEVRGMQGIKEAEYTINGTKIQVAVASGLANARKIIELVKSGAKKYDFIEIMACPGGCVNGGGQPVLNKDNINNRKARAAGLYDADCKLPMHSSGDNYLVNQVYQEHLGEPGGHVAHEYLHTHYQDRHDLLSTSGTN